MEVGNLQEFFIKGKKTYSLFCGWPFPRHSRPSSHGQIWLMLNASPPSGTKQLSPSTSRRLHTLSPWRRAQHIEAPQSLSTLHRAPEMMMRTIVSTHLDTNAQAEFLFITHWYSCVFSWFHPYLPVLLECSGCICQTCSWVLAHTGHLAGNISLLVLEEHTGQSGGRRRSLFHKSDHGHRSPTTRHTHLQPNSGKHMQNH